MCFNFSSINLKELINYLWEVLYTNSIELRVNFISLDNSHF